MREHVANRYSIQALDLFHRAKIHLRMTLLPLHRQKSIKHFVVDRYETLHS